MVNKITRDELISMRKSGQRFILVDVLEKSSFEREHIPGAISIPLSELETKAGSLLNKNDTVVVYCASFDCAASTKAAEKLQAMGFSRVLDYKGGLKDYEEGGEKLEGSIHVSADCSSVNCASCCACG
ncbi:MAG: rhodanese-like domain-containing protein [Candidatus Omnitrophota bacterium]